MSSIELDDLYITFYKHLGIELPEETKAPSKGVLLRLIFFPSFDPFFSITLHSDSDSSELELRVVEFKETEEGVAITGVRKVSRPYSNHKIILRQIDELSVWNLQTPSPGNLLIFDGIIIHGIIRDREHIQCFECHSPEEGTPHHNLIHWLFSRTQKYFMDEKSREHLENVSSYFYNTY